MCTYLCMIVQYTYYNVASICSSVISTTPTAAPLIYVLTYIRKLND